MKNRYIKSLKSKLAFKLNLRPVIEQSREDFRKYIPEPFNAVLFILADFELAWAWQYAKNINFNDALIYARKARRNIPLILDLCDEYNIPITWATVGHLFLEKCNCENSKPHPDVKRIQFFENNYWKYHKGDWFQNDPCSNYIDSPEWYGPDLIKDILSRKTEHEIGCHTFSHIDCRNAVCPADVFESEVTKCKELAKPYNIDLKSFVFPAHTIGNLDSLSKLGFSSYRSNYVNTLGFPVYHTNGLWEFKSTSDFEFKQNESIQYQVNYYKEIINRAVKHNKVAVFWFHPSLATQFILKVMQPLFMHIAKLKDEGTLQVTNFNNYMKFLSQS